MKIRSKEEVYTAKYFHIDRIAFERKRKSYVKDFIVRSPTVYILPIEPNGDIHMLLQHRDAFNKTILEIVAGTMEDGGYPLESAKRELHEETGLTAKTWKQIATWELSVNMNSPIYLFVATDLQKGEAHPDGDEEIQNITMPFSDVLDKIASGEIIAAPHVAALLLYKQLKDGGSI